MRLTAILLFAWSASAQVDTAIHEGVAALDRGDLVQAEAYFERATHAAPNNAGAWLLLAETYGKQNKREPAREAALHAEQLAGADPDVLLGLAHFYAEQEKDLGKAARVGARYAAAQPRDTTAWRRVAAMYLQAGEPDQAIAAGRRALTVDDSAELHSILGRAYSARRDWANATAELKRALAQSPYDEQAHFQLAQAYLLQQDFPTAISVLQNARKTFDKSPQIELALGVAYYGARDFSAAINQFLRTAKLAPDLPQPYVFLGRILEHAGDRLSEVEQRFAGFRQRNPNNPLGYVLHAKTVIAELPPSGFPAEAAAALDELNRAVAIAADNAEAHYLLGVLLDRKGEYRQAASHLEKSIALNAKDPAPHYRLARVYNRLGRSADAAQQRRLHEKLSEEEGGTAGRGGVKER